MSYVITVDFSIHAEDASAFLDELTSNARTSVSTEPGCRQFDVCVDPADPTRIFLYEVYDDRPAFEAHLASAHFKAFDRKTAAWTAAKSVRVLSLVR